MKRRWAFWRIAASVTLAAPAAIGLGSCTRVLQQNIEVLFAPEVLQTAVFLPFTWIYRVFGGWQL
ncbi:MAG: hypothetical protein L6Q92_02765 [Phycisphaerae bacterium]|nr:hypothetical protein [Phycisphaerae bacterium]